MIRYTKEMKQFIFDNYKGRSTASLAKLFNENFNGQLQVTVTQMKNFKGNNKLDSGLTGRFEKGHIPANKGTKGKVNVGGNRTSYKAGNLPYNTSPVGTEKELADGYVWIKVNNIPKVKRGLNWVPKHKFLYEQRFGPVPKGSTVIFKDGNRRNFDIDNLMLVSRAELLYLNQHKMIDSNKEITESAVLVARIMCKANELKRKKK